MKAIIKQNIYVGPDGNTTNLNDLIKAKILFIVNQQDHMVNPSGSIKLAEKLNDSLLILKSNCGHVAIICEADKIKTAVRHFL